MSQNIPIVGVDVNVELISKKIKEHEKKEENRTVRKEAPVRDSVSIQRKKGVVASGAEVKGPEEVEKKEQDRFETLKEAKGKLTTLVREEGRKVTPEEAETRLAEVAEETIGDLKLKITELKGDGKKGLQVASLERRVAKLEKALDDYRTEREASFAEAPVEMIGTAETPAETTLRTPEPKTPEKTPVLGTNSVGEAEEIAWQKLERFGFADKTRDFEVVEKRFAIATKNEAFLKREIKFLEKEIEKAKETFQTAKVKELEVSLASTKQKLVVLQKGLQEGRFAFHTIERQAVVRELGVEEKKEIQESLRPGQTVGTQSAGAPRSERQAVSGQSAATVTTASAGGPSAVSHQPSATVHTASATDTTSEFVPSNQTVATAAANDFSGTTLAIASTGGNLRAEAKKTDKIIKKLLDAALSGNWDAVKLALIFLDKRASTVVIGLGAQTIKAMQYYEKTMSALSKELGKLKGNEADYNAKLAKINSEMNLYSLNRQAIANFLRDGMTMREEVGNVTTSLLQKDSQIAASINRN